MKRLLFIPLILIALNAHALTSAIQAVISAGGAAAPTAFCDGFSGTMCEDFDGATDCSANTADNTCRYTWTEVAAGAAYNNTGLSTGNNVYIADNVADHSISYNWSSNKTEFYYYFKFKTANVTSSGDNFIDFIDSGGTARGYVNWPSGNNLTAIAGSVGTASVSAMTHGTLYHIHGYWKQSPGGATGKAWACFTTDGTAPSIGTGAGQLDPTDCNPLPDNCSCTASGDNNADTVTTIKIRNYFSGDHWGIYVDNIKVQDTAIGNLGN